ncbi:MAG: T9SS type A sorting domain-containing protein [Dinghuibacter sp.]|nr:T9SS type A sorting domain-containing protein [Dinghuibacter sp.]
MNSYGQNLAKATNTRIVVGAGTQVNITGGIQYTGTTQLTNNGSINLLKNPLNAAGGDHWADSTANVMDPASTGTVSFKSDRQQNVFGPTVFYNLETNGAGIQLLQSNEVRNNLRMNGGLVFFANAFDSIYVSNTSNSAISSTVTFNNSFVHGKLARRCNNTLVYLFPVGKILLPDSLYAPIQILKVNTNPAVYTAAYFPSLPPDAANFMNPPIDHISQLEYWEISSDILSGLDDDARVTLTWRGYSAVGATAATRDSLLVAHYINNTGFRWEPEYDVNLANNVAGTVAGGSVTTNINVGSFIQAHKLFTLGSRSPFNRLPLEQFNWQVNAVNNTSLVQWDVVNDVEIRQYEIERSLSGSLFTPVGSKTALGFTGRGNYQFTDMQPQPGWNFYRIKMMAANNRSYYSDIKKVFIGQELNISVYPNPARENLNIQFSSLPGGGALATITDASGRVILNRRLANNTTTLNTQNWARGIYLLRIQYEGGVFTRRLVKE